MAYCCVTFCKSSERKKAPGITFHRFPIDENIRNTWIKLVDRIDWTPTNSTRICSKHFKESDFKRLPKRNFLKHDAIPLVFEKPCQHRPKEENCETEDVNINSERAEAAGSLTSTACSSIKEENCAVKSANSNCERTKPTESSKCTADSSAQNLTNLTLAVIENVNLKRKLDKATKHVTECRKKIRSMQGIIQRQNEKIQDLNSLVQLLKKERFIDKFVANHSEALANDELVDSDF